jgi:isopenicillin-N epimerase
MNRRDFLGAAAVTTAATQLLRAAPAAVEPNSEAYWKLVRGQFPLEDGLLYFNAANVCPASRSSIERYDRFERDFQSNPSFQNRDKYTAMWDSTRHKIAAMLRVQAKEIAFTRNTSESNCTLVSGLDLKPGDEIVIAGDNHQSNREAWLIRAKRHGLVVKTVPTPAPAPSIDALVSSFDRAVTAKTRVLALTHVTNVNGLMFPAKPLIEMGRRRGVSWIHVDGAQTFAALDLNLKDMGCDSYSASTHKWLMGPLEAGILYVRQERVAEVWPYIVTAGWRDDLDGALKLEVYGQRDDPRIAGIDAAVDFVNLIGVRTIEARVRWLATYFKEQLKALPVELKTNLEPELSAGVTKISTGEANVKRHYDALWERHRVAISKTDRGPSAGLRFSAHIYNTKDDIDRVVEAIKKVVS